VSTHAGSSSLERFRQKRRAKLKRDWYLWAGILASGFLAAAMISRFGSIGLLIGGWICGFASAVVVVGWLIGFDVHTLTWLWGAWGEQMTADELAKLGDGWHVRHDIENAYGNWDHVAIGPTGVFMIDTKRLTGSIRVKDDGLTSGRIRIAGGAFRGASVGLRKALLERGARCPWVQAVAAIQGDFPDRLYVEKEVAYVAGDHLTEWLCSLPPKLSARDAAALAAALDDVRNDLAGAAAGG
jgi:Nuclease-related domain